MTAIRHGSARVPLSRASKERESRVLQRAGLDEPGVSSVSFPRTDTLRVEERQTPGSTRPTRCSAMHEAGRHLRDVLGGCVMRMTSKRPVEGGGEGGKGVGVAR